MFHAFRLLTEEYSIPLLRQMERSLKYVIYANSSKNVVFRNSRFSFAARPLCLDVVRALDKNIEIFPRSEFCFPSPRFQQCARAPRGSNSKQKEITMRLH